MSSREARSSQREARPEDFMDEEDLQEFADARKLVATEEFDVLGGTERELQARRKQRQEDEARGGVGFLGSSLMNLVQPTKDSVGVRLLRRLGWKPGQGIGPRITRQQRQRLEGEQDDIDDNDDVTFAPRDTPVVDYSAKKNSHGLGYELEKYVPQVAEMRRLRELHQRQRDEEDSEEPKGRAGFGLGAFEEDDDMDVYDDTRKVDYNYTLYEDETARHQRKRKHAADSRLEPAVKKARCSDGRMPLQGFSVATHAVELGKWYRPPQVPESFTGRHVAANQTPTTAERRDLTSDERGHILGETPAEPRSVFDYISNKNKDRLSSLLESVTEKRPRDPTKLEDFPQVNKQQANLALQGFMPFGDNPQKQARYRRYLEGQAGRLSHNGEPLTTLPVPEGMTHEAAMKEIEEFAKSARIFRPISAMMQGRFTSSQVSQEQTSFQGGLKTESEWRKDKEKREKEEQEAKKKEKKHVSASTGISLQVGLMLFSILGHSRGRGSCHEDVWPVDADRQTVLPGPPFMQALQRA